MVLSVISFKEDLVFLMLIFIGSIFSSKYKKQENKKMLAINRLKKVLVKIKRTTFNTPFEFTIINFGRIEDNLK